MAKCRQWLLWGALGVALLMAAVSAAQNTDPDLANVDDMLNGRWTIDPVDDLVAADPLLNSQSQFSAYNFQFYTNNNQISSYTNPPQNIVTLGCFANSPLPQQTRVGRMFALPNDVIITVIQNDCSKLVRVQVTDPVHNSSTQMVVPESTSDWLQAVVADFNFDGYEELMVINETTMYLITAVDVTDLSKGLTVVTTLLLDVSGNSTTSPMSQPVVGDFDNDGIPEVAWVGASGPGGDFDKAQHPMQVRFVSVCLLPNPACTGNTLTLRSTIINLADANSSEGGTEYCSSTSALAAGNFFPGLSGGDDLLIAITVTARLGVSGQYLATCKVLMFSYTFDTHLTPTKAQEQDNVYQSNNNANRAVQVFAAAAQLDWFGQEGEQAVLAFSDYYAYEDSNASISYRSVREVWVVTFDDNGLMSFHQSSLQSDDVSQIWGMAVGRFTTATDSTDQYNPRIAILRADDAVSSSKFTPRISFYSVPNPSGGDFTPQTSSSDDVEFASWSRQTLAQGFGNNLLQAGDLQGRSMRVGTPLVARITDHWQPKVLLAAPPMHVDYVQAFGASSPAVVNFSAIPATFNAQYQTAQTNSTQSSSTSTTSYSLSTGESAEEKIKFGAPLISSVSVDLKQSWQQTNDHTVANTYNTYSSTEFDASSTTGFSDVVWYSKADFNVYSYPVIGQTVCPQGQPNCTPAQQQPLYVQTSGPSNTTEYAQAGEGLEWYQPVQEPGNIFSYPWDVSQLQQGIGQELIQLSQGTALYTDDQTATYAATWSGSQGTDQTSGTTSTHSFESSNSLTGGTPDLDKAAGGVNLTAGFDYNNSTSISTLNTSTTTLGASTGVGGNKPDSFSDPDLYQYLFQPFIYGQAQSDGSVQNLSPDDVDIATHGFLLAGFVADPTDPNAGAWWQTSPYAQYIDVALNHPNRWTEGNYDNHTSNVPPECLLESFDKTTALCFTDTGPPDPANLWTSEFYWMRGLVVTVNGTGGPQRNQATEGDTVYLQARVYNYSLKAMAAGTQVHARFYRQPWDTTSETPIGESVLIEDVVVSDANGNPTIPAFHGGTFDPQGTELPNWVVTGTSFATTGLGDQTFIFWVVVWAQDASGNLVAELPGHGLTAVPGALGGIGEVPLEMVSVTYNSLTTNPTRTTSFANNVGFFKQPFYIQPASNSPSSLRPVSAKPSTAASASSQPPAEFAIQHLRVTPAQVSPNQTVVVSLDVKSKKGKAENVVVAFVDKESKVPFDVDLLTHIRADEAHRAEVPYRAASCGTHTIQVIVEPGSKAQKKKATTFKVDCDAKP